MASRKKARDEYKNKDVSFQKVTTGRRRELDVRDIESVRRTKRGTLITAKVRGEDTKYKSFYDHRVGDVKKQSVKKKAKNFLKGLFG